MVSESVARWGLRDLGYGLVRGTGDERVLERRSGTYGVQMGTECIVHSHDGWVPLEWHHVWPLGDGGPDIRQNKIRVCANGHYAIHAMLDAKQKTGGFVPWEYEKHFGQSIRMWAQKGWMQIQSGIFIPSAP